MVRALWKQEVRVVWVFLILQFKLALGFWLGTVVIEGLAGKMLFCLGVAFFFLLCAIKLEYKGEK